MILQTLDRIRLLKVEADLDAWLRYGTAHQIHGAILSYLQIHKEHFYLAESKEGQKSFVTARGWEDLSCLLKAMRRGASVQRRDGAVSAKRGGRRSI